MTLTFGSLFAGIGGFDLGLTRAGWRDTAQVEIDPHCRAVLARHFPDARRHDDITTASAATIGAVDLLCGGFPCQDLSVAGRRAGLAGERSGLFHEFMRLAAALAPRWVLIENVPGLLSSNGGGDMGVVLGTLGQLGYGWAYRSLDAQYFDLAQRRERVFIVGCLGDAARAAAVLFEPASGGGDSPPRREAGQDVAYCLAAGAGGSKFGSGRQGQDTFGDEGILPDIAATLRVPSHGAAWRGDGCDNLVQDVSGPLGGRSGEGGFRQDLDTHGAYIPSVRVFDDPGRFDAGGIHGGGDHGDLHPTIRSTNPAALVAYQCQGTNVGEMGTLRSGNGHVTGGVPFVATHALADSQRGELFLTDVANSLTGGGGKPGQGYAATVQGMAVRRLTPTECERLQGFPDGWTASGADGKPISDSTRYRMLGNAVAVPVMTWIGRRIIAAAGVADA